MYNHIMRRVSSSVLLSLSLFVASNVFADEIKMSSTQIQNMVQSVNVADQYIHLNKSFDDGMSIFNYIKGLNNKEPKVFTEWMSERKLDKNTAFVELRSIIGNQSSGLFSATYAAETTKSNTSTLQSWLLSINKDWSKTVLKEWTPNLLLDNPPILNKDKDFIAVKNLVTESSPTHSKSAILFVGGVNDTYKFWNYHIKEAVKGDKAVFGYEGPNGPGTQPHNVEYMDDNAENISDALFSLSKQGIEDIQIIAHSLGGVVSKKALLVFDQKYGSDTFKNISFTAVSSPFGGFASANSAPHIPFFKPISKMFNIAMASDMGPSNDFYKSISQSLNPSIKTRIIESPNDPVVGSNNLDVIQRYNATTSSFQTRIVVDGGNSHIYAQNPEFFKTNGIELIVDAATSEYSLKIGDI